MATSSVSWGITWIQTPIVEPSRSPYGRWMIRLSNVTFRYFWTREHADRWLLKYLQTDHTERERVANEPSSGFSRTI